MVEVREKIDIEVQETAKSKGTDIGKREEVEVQKENFGISQMSSSQHGC